MTCAACAAHADNPASGHYCLDCVMCCARLVTSAVDPEVMFQLIETGRDRPSRADVLQQIQGAERKANVS